MRAWGAATPKRTFVLSNSRAIGALDSGRMTRDQLNSSVKSTIKYQSKEGRKRFKGGKALKQTEPLSFHMLSF